MDNKEIRRRNLLWLKDKYAEKLGKRVATWPFLAEKWGADQAYLQHIKSETTKAFMGDAVARGIEKGEKKPHGWMDSPIFDHQEPKVREPVIVYGEELTDAEDRLLKMWRTWDDDIKRYAFGQMLVVSYTQEVLAQMFVIDGKGKTTATELDRYACDTVSETGEFRIIRSDDG